MKSLQSTVPAGISDSEADAFELEKEKHKQDDAMPHTHTEVGYKVAHKRKLNQEATSLLRENTLPE